jgi:hypothetical protein
VMVLQSGYRKVFPPIFDNLIPIGRNQPIIFLKK